MKPILIFNHVSCEPPGYITDLLMKMAVPFEVICLCENQEVEVKLEDSAALIFMGGAGDVNQPTDWMLKEMDLIAQADDRAVPVLGICLGAQMMSKVLGGEVWPSNEMEIGWHDIHLNEEHINHPWLQDMDLRFSAFHWHAHVFSSPPGGIAIAHSDCTQCQGFIKDQHLAIQFHLEMTSEIIQGLIEQYAEDLQHPSSCVQRVNQITENLSENCQAAFNKADQLLARWVRDVYV